MRFCEGLNNSKLRFSYPHYLEGSSVTISVLIRGRQSKYSEREDNVEKEGIGDILSPSKKSQKPLEAEGSKNSVLLWNLQKEHLVGFFFGGGGGWWVGTNYAQRLRLSLPMFYLTQVTAELV